MTSHARNTRELSWHLPPPLSRHWRGLFLGLVLVLFGVAVAVWSGGEASERKAILRMSPAERKALYDETLKSTESLCERADADPALLDRCWRSAEFLLAFPECDASCQELAHRHRHGPTR